MPYFKIAHIGSRGIPANYSGVEKVIEETSKHLTNEGFKISIYCHSKDFELSEYCGIKLIKLPTITTKHLTTFIHSLLSTVHVLFTDTDIAHYHCLGPSIFSFIPRFFGKKTIVTVQGLDWKRKKWNPIAQFLLKLCEIPAMYFPNKTTVVSAYLQNYFIHKYNKKTYYIPNGVSLPLHPPLSTLHPNNYILFVGRLVPEKGVHYLIKAFNLIDTEKELWIAGSPSFTEKYVSKLNEISGPKIKFLGPVYGDKLAELYKNAYCFVLPSEIEGCPLSLLEAMSYGKCCLVSNLPECIENISECVVSFKNKDYVDLKEKLKYLIVNPYLVENLGKKAKEKAEQLYSWDKIMPLWKEIYHGLLG